MSRFFIEIDKNDYRYYIYSAIVYFCMLRMEAYEAAKKAGHRNPAKAVSHMSGFYRCCIYKWKKTRIRDDWGLLCRACPRIAKKCKEIPDLLKTYMGRKTKFKSRTPNQDDRFTSILPAEFEAVISEALASLTVI